MIPKMTAGTRKAYVSKGCTRLCPERDRRLARDGDQQPEWLGDLRERIQGRGVLLMSSAMIASPGSGPCSHPEPVRCRWNPALAQPVSRSSAPKASAGPSAPAGWTPPAAALAAAQARIGAVKE